MKQIGRIFTLIAAILAGIGARTANAQESVLYSFGGVTGDPSLPNAALISDSEGNLYGTSPQGGANNNGAVFELSPKAGGGWAETVLYSFQSSTSGQSPLGSLVFDKEGNLYGTTSYGGPSGSGTAFELSPAGEGVWTEKTLYAFGANSTDGGLPQANLIFDSEGNLYGTTEQGNGTGGNGVIFELSPTTSGPWTEKVLHTFAGTQADGCTPKGGLIFDADGSLYGTTGACGAANSGNIGGIAFELSPGSGGNWTETVLWNFGLIQGDGSSPQAGLVFDGQGNLYGTTLRGGDNGTNYGVVFEMSPGGGQNGTWKEKVLWNFAGGPADGANPVGDLIFDAQGNLYGTTYSGGSNGYAVNNGYYLGTVFELSPTNTGAWSETILHDFYATTTDGFNPQAGLIADTAGNLFGTTSLGGAYDGSRYTNDGTVFEIAATGLPDFSLATGTYVGTQSVTLTSATKDASIYYTTDGTTPTAASTKYSDPIDVSKSETIKAFAVASGYPNSAVVSATYTIEPPVIKATLSPATLTLPSTNYGATSAAQMVTLTNTGNTAMKLYGPTFTGTDASSFHQSATNCPATLAASASCTISIEFKPASLGSLTATYSLSDNASNSPQTVALSGTATQTSGITASLSPSSLTFTSTTVGATSAAQVLTLTNTGSTAIKLGHVSITGTDANSFLQSATNCPGTLAVSGTCTISIEFKPAAAGTLTATYSLADNATNSPQTVALSGTGGSSNTITATLTPASLTFPATSVGSTSAAQTLTLANTGNTAMKLGSVSITGTNATSFHQSATNCPATLAASASCTISIEFKPTTNGTLTATYSLSDNATNSPQTVALSGTGGSAPTITATFTPSSLGFPATAQGVASAAQVVTLKNTGSAAMTLGRVSFTGADASSFLKSATNCPASLAAGATCTVSLEFKPAAAGTLTATFSLADNATNSPQTVTLSGTGNP